MPSRVLTLAVLVTVLVAVGTRQASAQDEGPKVGDPAPDFTLPGASKAGVLEKALRLADFRGQTVVVSFFPKARTKG